MQRVRREVPVAAGAGGRLGWALGLSAALHVAVIVGIGAQAARTSTPSVSVIAARLMPAEVDSSPSVDTPALAEVTPPAKADAQPAASVPVTEEAHIVSEEAPSQAAPAPAAVEVAALDDVPDSTHYAAKDLDVYPRLTSALQPAYPELSRSEHIAGWVKLLVTIDERGRVTDAAVVDAFPAGLFEESARAAFLEAAFAPARRAGRAVRSRVLVDIAFDPDRAPR